MRYFKIIGRIYLPSLVLISILSILSSCRNIREHGLFGRKSLDEAIEWAKQDSMRVADSLESAEMEENLPEESIMEATVPAEVQSRPENDDGIKYYVIVGSFSNYDNAVQESEHYRVQGYETSIVNRTNSSGTILYMVSIKTFNELNEAESYNNTFKREVLSSAWVYESK